MAVVTVAHVAPVARKKAFVRTEISRTERAIGAAILVLLAGIGAGVWLKGRAYDPARYTGDTAALESTREAVAGKAATLRAGDLRAFESGGAAADTPAAGAADAGAPGAIRALAAGLTASGPTERYDAETLYEKINGRAPAYFEYNFQELTCRSFALDARPGEYVDVYLFRMDTPLNAFGIFSAERDSSGAALDYAADGYRSGMGLFLRAGATYAQVLASSEDPAVMAAADAFARGLVAELPADDTGLEGRALLPAAGRVPGSLVYIAENAYGQEILKGVFEARYTTARGEVTAFAMASADAAAARAAYDALRAFHAAYGELAEEAEDRFVADLFGQWSAIAVRGTALTGVVNAPSREAAAGMEF